MGAPLVPSKPETIAKIGARVAIRRRFSELRQQAAALLEKADKLAVSALSDVEVQQVRAAKRLAGAHFYSISEPPDGADFMRLHDDLQHVAASIDPLILAIGKEARSNSTQFKSDDLADCFTDQVERALDGNALHVLARCAAAAHFTVLNSDERADDKAEHRRELQAGE